MIGCDDMVTIACDDLKKQKTLWGCLGPLLDIVFENSVFKNTCNIKNM